MHKRAAAVTPLGFDELGTNLALSSQGSRQGPPHSQGLQCLTIPGGLHLKGACLTSVVFPLSSPPPSAGAGAHVQRHAACGRPARFGAVVHRCAALRCAALRCLSCRMACIRAGMPLQPLGAVNLQELPNPWGLEHD